MAKKQTAASRGTGQATIAGTIAEMRAVEVAMKGVETTEDSDHWSKRWNRAYSGLAKLPASGVGDVIAKLTELRGQMTDNDPDPAELDAVDIAIVDGVIADLHRLGANAGAPTTITLTAEEFAKLYEIAGAVNLAFVKMVEFGETLEWMAGQCSDDDDTRPVFHTLHHACEAIWDPLEVPAAELLRWHNKREGELKAGPVWRPLDAAVEYCN